MLRNAISITRERRPFKLGANVLLPDHWHLIIRLPSGDANYSLRISQIKKRFGDQWLAAGLGEAKLALARRQRMERGIWQPRFWEHCIRDEEDLERCTDYIHWNPRKHGLVSRVCDWPWSTFHRFVRAGQYDVGWGGQAPHCGDDRGWGEPAK